MDQSRRESVARDASLGEPFRVALEPRGGTVVVRLYGALGSECGEMLEKALDRAGEQASAGLVLDMRGLTFIDSSGLRLVVGARERCSARGLSFAIAPGSGQVRRAFDLSGLGEKLTVVEDPGELKPL